MVTGDLGGASDTALKSWADNCGPRCFEGVSTVKSAVLSVYVCLYQCIYIYIHIYINYKSLSWKGEFVELSSCDVLRCNSLDMTLPLRSMQLFSGICAI